MNTSRINITILVDNRISSGLTAEHGLSFLVENEDQSILFDTGQGKALPANAGALNVELKKIDSIVLSHGHFDHTGGIPHVLDLAPKAAIFCHPGVVQPRYAIRNGSPTAIQMPKESKAAIDKMPPQLLHWIAKPVMLSDRIGITGPIPRETDFEDAGGPFFLDPAGTRPDPISDDMAMWIETENGLVVCVGCSHAGLVNTLNYIRRLNDGKRIHAVIGGFHLIHAGSERIEKTITQLKTLAPEVVAPCHCTGQTAVDMMTTALGKQTIQGHSGMTFQF